MDNKLIVVLAVFALVLTNIGDILYQDGAAKSSNVKNIVQTYG